MFPTNLTPPSPPRPKKRIIRLPFILLAIPLILGGLFYLVENWRGPRVFRQHLEDLAAQGEQLSQKQFQTPPVPAEQNFMMAPAWGQSLKSRDPWQMEFPVLLSMRPDPNTTRGRDEVILSEWAPWEGQISQLDQAALTAPYSSIPAPPGAETPVGFVRAMCESLLYRSWAAQHENNPRAAAQSFRIIFRIHGAFAAKPELSNQLCATAIAGLTVFGPEHPTAWSRGESEMIARGLQQMDCLPDFALALRYDRAALLDWHIYKDGNLCAPPKGSWLPSGWSGLAFAWWLDLQQFRIESAAAWPAVLHKPDPRIEGPRIWQGFANVNVSSDDDIASVRTDCLEVRMRVALARFEHAFGWYRREHSRDIEKPEDLQPYLTGAWPVDPWTGKPHTIEPEDGRWCIRWNKHGLPPGPKDIWNFPTRFKTVSAGGQNPANESAQGK